MKIRARSLIFAILAWGVVAPASADLADALTAARNGDWALAEQNAEIGGEIAQDLIAWTRLHDSVGTFEEYHDFLTRNGDWPGLVPLRRAGELKITPQTPPMQVLQYFRSRHAGTPHGALYLADALKGRGRFEDARSEIVLAWRMLSFSRSEQAIFQNEFADLIRPHNFARLDRLLWRGQHDQAVAMYPFLTARERALSRARIVLRKKGRGVDARVGAVADPYKDDPGLAFERYLWRFEKGRRDAAEDLILERSKSADALGIPSYWSSTRRVLARDALQDGRNEVAYELAANHYLTGGNDFADLEWLAGFIALTRLDDANQALRHFRRFRAGTNSPVSMGRAAYWESAAYTALDRPDDANVALEFGAEFQTGFYGLLSAQAAGLPMDPEIYRAAPQSIAGASFLKDRRLTAALMLARAGEHALSARFFAHLYDYLTREDQQRLGDLALVLDELHVAVTLGKLAASRGELLARPYFPLADIAESDVPPELILSIIRRESEFNPVAVSRAGARGLMQLMPNTAKEVAGNLGEPYKLDELTGDTAYNMRLGTEYLRFLQNEFLGNVLLVASAYNAGPTRTARWIKRYGDPRKRRVDPLEWIESIPFRETRNYVMRVAESVVIYRARIAGEAQDIRLMDEIKN